MRHKPPQHNSAGEHNQDPLVGQGWGSQIKVTHAHVQLLLGISTDMTVGTLHSHSLWKSSTFCDAGYSEFVDLSAWAFFSGSSSCDQGSSVKEDGCR